MSTRRIIVTIVFMLVVVVLGFMLYANAANRQDIRADKTDTVRSRGTFDAQLNQVRVCRAIWANDEISYGLCTGTLVP